jgi:hypothetical protein
VRTLVVGLVRHRHPVDGAGGAGELAADLAQPVAGEPLRRHDGPQRGPAVPGDVQVTGLATAQVQVVDAEGAPPYGRRDLVEGPVPMGVIERELLQGLSD